MYPRQLLIVFYALTCFASPLLAAQPAAFPDTPYPAWQPGTQQREPWNLGVHPPNWTGSSTLTIENQCKGNHHFDVVPDALAFVHFQGPADKVLVAGHQTKELALKFDTTGMQPGDYKGQVVVKCADCNKEPTCTQDREFVPVHLVIAPPSQPQSTGPSESSPPQPPNPPVSEPQTGARAPAQGCDQSVAQPAPDLLSLLSYKGYTARINELSPAASREPQTSITGHPQFQALMGELQKKGYSFSPGFTGAKLMTIDLRQGNCSTKLTVGSFRSNPKPDGTMAGITVAMNTSAPDQSLFQTHITNVYALQPEEMPKDNPTIRFNSEPWFTVQVGEAPPARFASQFGPVIWYRYWWYDSHRHANWWYGCYQWWWWRYSWYGRPWYWWYNWWWGYYYWWNWNYWSTWWAPYGPYQGMVPE